MTLKHRTAHVRPATWQQNICCRHAHKCLNHHLFNIYQLQNWSVRTLPLSDWQTGNMTTVSAAGMPTAAWATTSIKLELVSQNSVPVRPAAWQQNICCKHAHRHLNHHLFFIKFRTGPSEFCPWLATWQQNICCRHAHYLRHQFSPVEASLVSGEDAFSSLDDQQCTPVFV